MEAKIGQGKNFLLLIKRNGSFEWGVDLLASNVFYTYDNKRTFLLVFAAKENML